MTSGQRNLLILGMVAFVAMSAYPPWLHVNVESLPSLEGPFWRSNPVVYATAAAIVTYEGSADYAFIFSPPQYWHYERKQYEPSRLDLPRLIIQWLMLAACVGTLWILAEDEKRKSKKAKES